MKMANKNPKIGDQVILSVSWQMLGWGELPTWLNKKDPMIIIKKCKSGLYQCAIPGKRKTASLSKTRLKIIKG